MPLDLLFRALEGIRTPNLLIRSQFANVAVRRSLLHVVAFWLTGNDVLPIRRDEVRHRATVKDEFVGLNVGRETTATSARRAVAGLVDGQD
jgi:hypothetical protein